MEEATVRWRVVVSGRVQGVWFRESCRRRAESLRLAGWVANRPDGSVEAVFEGPAPAVAEAVDWCRKGPPSARVSGVETFREPPAGVPGFRIA